jgi:hypothetical protein
LEQSSSREEKVCNRFFFRSLWFTVIEKVIHPKATKSFRKKWEMAVKVYGALISSISNPSIHCSCRIKNSMESSLGSKTARQSTFNRRATTKHWIWLQAN